MKLLKKLSDINGPSGNENIIRNLILSEMKKYVDEIYIDKIGNLICRKKGRGPKVMLAAHMDEICLIVNEIRDDGKIKISKVGGVTPITFIGQKVDVLGKGRRVTGVLTSLELHEGLMVSALPTIYDLYVDTGFTKEDLKKMGIEIGSFIVPRSEFELINNNRFACGKALDDRVGCYILVELAKKLRNTNQQVYYVFTVQEEIGLHGARISVYEINPDWGIAVDTTNAEDSSTPRKTSIGKGPCITVKDVEVISNNVINSWLSDLSKHNKIPVQFKVDDFGTTDMARIILSKESVPSTSINVPIRNIHSSIGIASVRDIEHTIKILYILLKTAKNRKIT